jgi:hypothetical protein
MWQVLYLPEAEDERADLPPRERTAVDNAAEKLKNVGPTLGPPHASAVLGWDDLRELRPQAGKSPWRPLYRQVGDPYIIAAIAPEAKKDRRGFDRACAAAVERLKALEEEDDDQDTQAQHPGEQDDRSKQKH